MSPSAIPFTPTTAPSWRSDAIRIVEQLFAVTPAGTWNLLLDLRGHLLREDWSATLNAFLECREALESDHYLPLYRLRRLLAASLRLEIGPAAPQPHAVRSLEDLLRRGHRSLAEIKRAVRRDLFEHALDLPDDEPVALRFVEMES